MEWRDEEGESSERDLSAGPAANLLKGKLQGEGRQCLLPNTWKRPAVLRQTAGESR
jgi:hypothetical protein